MRMGLKIITILFCLSPATALAQDAAVEGRCLAEALYFEARNQGWRGQLAVGVIILNRVDHPKYPNTVCEVIRQGRYWQGNPVKDACQFSFWCDQKHERPQEQAAWDTAKEIAQLLLMRNIEIAGLEGATHYHATSVTPGWSKVLERRQKIGDHVFYARR
jgi:spore germination cell wall hydrolase CwlJ-like protein